MTAVVAKARISSSAESSRDGVEDGAASTADWSSTAFVSSRRTGVGSRRARKSCRRRRESVLDGGCTRTKEAAEMAEA